MSSSRPFGLRGGAETWPGNSFASPPVAVVEYGFHGWVLAELLGDALGAHRGLVAHSARPFGSRPQGAALLVADGGGLDSLLPPLARDEHPSARSARLRAADLSRHPVDAQCDVLSFGVGEHVIERAQPHPGGRCGTANPGAASSGSNLADRSTDGGRAHLVDHPQGLVGESGSQVDQRHQEPVDEDQPVLRAVSGLMQADTLATFVPFGLAPRLSPRPEFGGQFTEVRPEMPQKAG